MKKRQYSSLHEWLDRTGTPQYVLAEKAGLTQGALSSLLRGSRRCSLMKAVKLEEITGVPVKNLVEWPKFKKPHTSLPSTRKQAKAQVQRNSRTFGANTPATLYQTPTES